MITNAGFELRKLAEEDPITWDDIRRIGAVTTVPLMLAGRYRNLRAPATKVDPWGDKLIAGGIMAGGLSLAANMPGALKSLEEKLRAKFSGTSKKKELEASQ